jgi:hypothetical protein
LLYEYGGFLARAVKRVLVHHAVRALQLVNKLSVLAFTHRILLKILR